MKRTRENGKATIALGQSIPVADLCCELEGG